LKPKYKAFHKKEKKIVPVDAIDFLNNSTKGNDGDCYGAVINNYFVPIDDIVLLRLTGRYDKNGVEIQEGHTLLTPFNNFGWNVKFGEFFYQEAHSSMIGFYIECSVTNRVLPLTDFERHEIVGEWLE